MNDVDFPVARVLDAIDAAVGRGTRLRSRSTSSSSAARTTTSIVEMARRFRGTGHIVRFIEYMDVGNTNGWRMTDVVSGARDRRTHRRALADRAGCNRTTSARSPNAGATSTAPARSASSPRSRSRSAAAARAPASPPTASSISASSPAPATTCAPSSAAARTTTTIAAAIRARLAHPRRPLLRDPLRGHAGRRRWRCRTSAGSCVRSSERSESRVHRAGRTAR